MVLGPVKVKVKHPLRHLANLFDFQSRVCLDWSAHYADNSVAALAGIQSAGVCNHKTFNSINE